jgi:CheY-like chemotaxis protein
VSALQRKRVLIVEDEFFIGAAAREMLEELGAIVIGPAATVSEALALAATEDIDVALLDVNLYGHSSVIVAAKLDARQIPMVFATGYDNRADKDWAGRYFLGKPYTQEKLAAQLCCALEAAAVRKGSPS